MVTLLGHLIESGTPRFGTPDAVPF